MPRQLPVRPIEVHRAVPDGFGLLFHGAGSNVYHGSLIHSGPGYFDAAFDAPGNSDLDFNGKLLNFL
jgi:hypothetical protein